MKTVIITAGGIGKRMGGNLPKQFLVLGNEPVLMHTLRAFHTYDPSIQLLLTLPEDWISFWESLIEEYQFPIQHRVVAGGVERYHSIQQALRFATGDLIAVHDGVRPLVSRDTIARCFDAAETYPAVVPTAPIAESIRFVAAGTSKAVPRADYVLVQTPQVFQRAILEHAYTQAFHDQITDDASLVEQSGISIHLVDGNPENIKLTRPVDLLLAEALLRNDVLKS